MSVHTEIKQIKAYADLLTQEPSAILYAVVLEQHASELLAKVKRAHEAAQTLGLTTR